MPDALHGDTVSASLCVYVFVLLCKCCMQVCLYISVNIFVECILIHALYHICIVSCVHFYLCLQDESHRARCDHEKAAGGGLEDETKIPAGDGEKLSRTSGGAREEGTHSTS